MRHQELSVNDQQLSDGVPIGRADNTLMFYCRGCGFFDR